MKPARRRAEIAETRARRSAAGSLVGGRAFQVVAVDQPIPRMLLTKSEAAASLGVSVDFFEAHIQHELRLVRRGRLVLVPVRELERWIEDNAARTLGAA